MWTTEIFFPFKTCVSVRISHLQYFSVSPTGTCLVPLSTTDLRRKYRDSFLVGIIVELKHRSWRSLDTDVL